MTNPYRAPESQVEAVAEPGSRSVAVIQLVVGLICSAIAALGPILVLPKVERVFGSDVPLMTRYALDYHLWFWALPLAVIAVHFLWPRPERRHLVSCLTGVIGLVITTVFSVLAMYLPVVKLFGIV